MFRISIEYPISVRNKRIHAGLVENNSFYNGVRTELVEILEGNQYNDFKAIVASFGIRKPLVIDLDTKIPLNLLLITPFHSIVINRSMTLDLGRDPLEPPRGVAIIVVQLLVPYSRPFKKPLNYLEN